MRNCTSPESPEMHFRIWRSNGGPESPSFPVGGNGPDRDPYENRSGNQTGLALTNPRRIAQGKRAVSGAKSFVGMTVRKTKP